MPICKSEENRPTDFDASPTLETPSTWPVLRAVGKATFVFHLARPQPPENGLIDFQGLQSLLARTVRFHRDTSKTITAASNRVQITDL